MEYIKPADKYISCPELCVVTTYFNPGQDKYRLANYNVFAESLKLSDIPLLTVECAFCEDPFTLKPASDVIQIRSHDILWQKERLFNLAVSRLPQQIRKVAWIDADVLFSNPAWAVESSALLDEFPVVQLWEYAVRLPTSTDFTTGKEEIMQSMASVLSQDPTKIRKGGMDVHGHTGFAWAADRSLLDQYGLYDTGFDVGADHLIAHAFWGDYDGPCMHSAMGIGVMQNSLLRHNSSPILSWLRRILPEAIKSHLLPWRRWHHENEGFRKHFLTWARSVYKIVQGYVSFTPGTILHLWHSNKTRLAPWQVRKGLHENRFDPRVDLRISSTGCWEWAKEDSNLRRWVDDHTPLLHQHLE